MSEPGKWGDARSSFPLSGAAEEGAGGRPDCCSRGLQTEAIRRNGKEVRQTGHLEIRT